MQLPPSKSSWGSAGYLNSLLNKPDNKTPKLLPPERREQPGHLRSNRWSDSLTITCETPIPRRLPNGQRLFLGLPTLPPKYGFWRIAHEARADYAVLLWPMVLLIVAGSV